MPVVKTYFEKEAKDTAELNQDTSLNIQNLIYSVTSDILRESPKIVVEVESGNMDKAVLEKLIIQQIDKKHYTTGLSRDEIIKQVFNYMFGYGILHELLEDEDISDIDISKYNQATYTKYGKRQRLDISFGSEKYLEAYCKLLAIRNGGILNENDTHCRVADEKRRLRINLSIRPRNISGPAVSIRKHRMNSYTQNDLVKLNMMNEEIAEFTASIAKSRASFVICGKGASGKTTLFRAIINNMRELERVLVVESDSELYPDKPNCIVQRVKKKNEGGRIVTLDDLTKDGLTMTLDTYCIGEIVGAECWEFIKAGFTGHRVAATLHSGSAEEAFTRMLSMAKEAANESSEKTIKQLIEKGIDIIYFMDDFKIVDICEVIGYDSLKDEFSFNHLYKYEYDNQSFNKCGEIGNRLKSKLRGCI